MMTIVTVKIFFDNVARKDLQNKQGFAKKIGKSYYFYPLFNI